MKEIMKFIMKQIYLNTIMQFIYIIFYIPILIKYKKDTKLLPLTSKHKKLYVIIHQHYFRKLIRFPDLLKCEDFNDKIQWLKLFDQRKEMVECSDKIRMKKYVHDKGGRELTVKTIAVYDKVSEIKWNELGTNFIVKTNHDSGTNIVFKEFSKNKNLKKQWLLLIAKIRLQLALYKNFGRDTGEWAYTFVKRKVIVEELLISNDAINDYKFYVVNGNVKFCHYICDRKSAPKEEIILADGASTSYRLHKKFKTEKRFQRPKDWDRMIEIAECLGSDFRLVRIDMYYVDGRIYVGEFTFWPQAGCYKGEDRIILGRLLDFNMDIIYDPVYF